MPSHFQSGVLVVLAMVASGALGWWLGVTQGTATAADPTASDPRSVITGTPDQSVLTPTATPALANTPAVPPVASESRSLEQLRAWSADNPHDLRAARELANRLQQVGLWQEALAPLHLLVREGDEALAATARQEIRLLIAAAVAHARNQNDYSVLVSLAELLFELDPYEDGYRVLAAEWAIRDRRFAEAEALLAQVGSAEWLDRAARLRKAMELSRSGIQMRRNSDGHLTVTVNAATGPSAQLLVDTGASITVVRPELLRAWRAQEVCNGAVRLQGIGGVTGSKLWRVEGLSMGGVALDKLNVAGVPMADGVDGILGLDALEVDGYGYSMDTKSLTLWLDRVPTTTLDGVSQSR